MSLIATIALLVPLGLLGLFVWAVNTGDARLPRVAVVLCWIWIAVTAAMTLLLIGTTLFAESVRVSVPIAPFTPVVDPQSGHLTRVIKIATDITEHVEEATRAAALVAAIERSMAVIEFAPDGTVLRANDNFLQTMGYSAGEVIGKHHRLFCPTDLTGSGEYENFWRDLQAGHHFNGQFCRLNKSGMTLIKDKPVFFPGFFKGFPVACQAFMRGFFAAFHDRAKFTVVFGIGNKAVIFRVKKDKPDARKRIKRPHEFF